MPDEKPSPFSQPLPWELVAEGYAATTMNFLSTYTQAALSELDLKSDSRIVDVACGPGTVTRLLADQVASIDAIDFSAPMLELLRQYLSQHKITNVRPLLGDGQALPYADASFDFGFSMFGLMFFPDRLQGFRELRRVLKPGGKAVVSSWAPVSDSPMMQLMFGALKAANPAMPEPKANTFNLENPDVFKSEMEAAGFKNVEIKRCTQYVEATSLEHFWEFMTVGSAPIVLLRKNSGEEKWKDMEVAALAYLRQEMQRFPCQLGSDAWVGVGVG